MQLPLSKKNLFSTLFVFYYPAQPDRIAEAMPSGADPSVRYATEMPSLKAAWAAKRIACLDCSAESLVALRAKAGELNYEVVAIALTADLDVVDRRLRQQGCAFLHYLALCMRIFCCSRLPLQR